MSKKKCTKCEIEKNYSEFTKNKRSPLGLSYQCKKCRSEGILLARRLKENLAGKIYSKQKAYSKRRGHENPSYTKEELNEWLYSQQLFHELYQKWKDSGFYKLKAISIDRINDDIGYTMSNIQLMTWEENRAKYHKERQKDKKWECRRPVDMMLENTVISNFYSVSAACEHIGVGMNVMKKWCETNAFEKGHTWRYSS